MSRPRSPATSLSACNRSSWIDLDSVFSWVARFWAEAMTVEGGTVSVAAANDAIFDIRSLIAVPMVDPLDGLPNSWDRLSV